MRRLQKSFLAVVVIDRRRLRRSFSARIKTRSGLPAQIAAAKASATLSLISAVRQVRVSLHSAAYHSSNENANVANPLFALDGGKSWIGGAYNGDYESFGTPMIDDRLRVGARSLWRACSINGNTALRLASL